MNRNITKTLLPSEMATIVLKHDPLLLTMLHPALIATRHPRVVSNSTTENVDDVLTVLYVP